MLDQGHIKRWLRSALVLSILAVLILPAVALRVCPMMGVTVAAACCCRASGSDEANDTLLRDSRHCCDGNSTPPVADTLTQEASPHLADAAMTVTTYGAMPNPVARAPVPRVRGPPGVPASRAYLIYQRLLL